MRPCRIPSWHGTEGSSRALPISPLNGRNYAPTIFEGMEGNGGYRKTVFTRAMERPLKGGWIVVIADGPASRSKQRLVRADDTGGAE
jgi:hypothetical protein